MVLINDDYFIDVHINNIFVFIKDMLK